MGDMITIFSIIGITLLIILAIIIVLTLLFLFVPVFYEVDAGTNNITTYANARINSFLNIISLEIMNKLMILKIFGFKIKLKGHDKKDKKNKKNKNLNTIYDGDDEYVEVFEEDYVPEDASIFRKIKIKSYIFERKVKEKSYKFRKTVNSINEYKYKMDLLKKTIEFIQKILNIIKPKKSEICVEIGTGSNEITGKLIASLSMLCVMHNNVCIKPNFDKKVLSITAYAKGRIMPIKLLILVCKFTKSEPVKELKALKKKGY